MHYPRKNLPVSIPSSPQVWRMFTAKDQFLKLHLSLFLKKLNKGIEQFIRWSFLGAKISWVLFIKSFPWYFALLFTNFSYEIHPRKVWLESRFPFSFMNLPTEYFFENFADVTMVYSYEFYWTFEQVLRRP